MAVALALILGGAQPLRAQNATPAAGSATPVAPATVSQSKSKLQLPADSTFGDDYHIGPEDVLSIKVFDVKDLDETVRVSNNGTISVPLLGRLVASGLTPHQLRKKLEKAYGKTYLQNPQVSVFVKQFHAQPISVIGAVEKPGMYQITGPRTLIDAIAMAGGLSNQNATPPGKTLYVTREGGFEHLHLVSGMEKVSPDKLAINIQDLLYTRATGLNIFIKPHDIIAVSKASVIYVVGGGVRKPGGFALNNRDQVNVIQALAMAEGLAPDASKKRARIIHTNSDGSRVTTPINIAAILKEKAPDPNLEANDILYIPLSGKKAAFRKSTETIVQTVSGILVYHPP